MAETGKVYPVEALVGRTVLARATAHRLGQLQDLVIDPVEGRMVGLAVKVEDGSLRYAELSEIYSIGPDAVMLNNDRSAIPVEGSPIKELPLALNKLNGAEVITEGGRTLGHIANVFMSLTEEPLIIYEARSSLLDKLLGRALFFPASFGQAFDAKDARLVVSDDTAEKADGTLEALTEHLFGPPKAEDPVVIIRSRSH